MDTQFLSCSPTVSAEQKHQMREWVVKGSTPNTNNRNELTAGMSKTQLLFNEAIPACARNLATRVRLPAPIVIEHLLPQSEDHESIDSTSSSISFTSVSEERLHAAIQRAKRDLRRRRFESLGNSPAKASQEHSLLETTDVELVQPQELAAKANETKLKIPLAKKKPDRPGAIFQKNPISPRLLTGQSPPTRDPSSRLLEGGKRGALSQVIHKLHNELEVYIHKVEELANRAGGKKEVPLEPEEQNRLEIRRQKQAAFSARKIYVLQQQVNEIQEDIETSRSQKIWGTKKSLVINRLAAAHRGAFRALQFVVHQLSDQSLGKILPSYKELGQLLRQLSLCSAMVEEDDGSSVPKMALSILQKLETLDCALSKQEMFEETHARACPPQRKSPVPIPTPGAPKGPSMSSVQGHRKPTNPKRGVHAFKRMASRKPKATFLKQLNQREVPRPDLEAPWLAQQRELREQPRQPQTNTARRKGGALHSARSKTVKVKVQDVGFQQPTVSSQLRVNQLPQKDPSVPWIPTSPHSPPSQRRSPQRTKPEPRCLFSPVKPSSSPPKQKLARGLVTEQPALSPENRSQAQREALREAWLDKKTIQRLKELNQLSKEEAERIQTLRSQIVSPTEWAERAEQKIRKRIWPLLDEAQAAESAEQLSEALLEDLLEDTARAARAAEADRQFEALAECRMQAPTLESMLLRMEEIQRDQEEVRRRFATITYSDPYWGQPGAAVPQRHSAGSRPVSPQPIKLTRPVVTQNSAADVLLEKPVDTGHCILSESSLTEEASQDNQQPRYSVVFPGPVDQSSGTVISVPSSTLRDIRQYRQDYEAYLRAVAHQAVGSFNPWAVADSLAEELLSEALADVVVEFQDVLEEYAEAVFTSEFLQPLQSPPASAVGPISQ